MSRILSVLIVAHCWWITAANGPSCKGPLLWSDEFEGGSGDRPSQERWSYAVGDGSDQGIPGWGNGELQYYTEDNAALDGSGHLVLEANVDLGRQRNCSYGPCRYTSARLSTKFSTKYGRVEARVKGTSAQGTWPAFWMLGANIGNVSWPECGEIDILEARGSRQAEVGGAIHGPGYSGAKAFSHSYTLPNGSTMADDFHVVAVDWQPYSLEWSVDGTVYGKEHPRNGTKWVFDHPFYMLLNLAVGGHYDGEPQNDTEFPQYFTIDYIRVYGPECTWALQEESVTDAEGLGKNEAPLPLKARWIGICWTPISMLLFHRLWFRLTQ